MAQVQFNSYAGGPHGGGPVVLPMQPHPIGDIGDALGALGNIPGQIQGMQFKQALNDLLMKAITTPTTVPGTAPMTAPEGLNVPPNTVGDMFTQPPQQAQRIINPEYSDLARKLEVLGYYKPNRGYEGRRYESPQEEALRAGLKETEIQKAKAPEREEARASREAIAREGIEQRRETAEQNRLAREHAQGQENIIARERIEASRASADAANATRGVMAEIARQNANTAKIEAEARRDKVTAENIARLQTRLESVQNQIKSPPPTAGGDRREWNYGDPKDQSTLRQYIQQENTIMDQLEKYGINFPERRKLMEEEKNFIASWWTGSPTRGKIVPTTRGPSSVTTPPATSTSLPPVPTGQYPDGRTDMRNKPAPTTETPEQRRKRLLGE